MIKFFYSITIFSVFFFFSNSFRTKSSVRNTTLKSYSDTIHFPGEKHFANIRQLTFGGDNAEAYFSYDGKYLIFQRKNEKEGIQCDQIWMGKIPTSDGEKFTPKLVSTGTGRTTCSLLILTLFVRLLSVTTSSSRQ